MVTEEVGAARLCRHGAVVVNEAEEVDERLRRLRRRGRVAATLRRGGGLFLQSCSLTVERPRGEGELTVMVAESEKYRRLRERAISGVAYKESEQ